MPNKLFCLFCILSATYLPCDMLTKWTKDVTMTDFYICWSYTIMLIEIKLKQHEPHVL